MKNLFTALVAVFFMFTAYGCGDDAEPETSTDVVEAEATEDAGTSDAATEGEGEVEDTGTPAEDDSADDSAEGESE